jgi:two-component system, sporulation sensor kinase E
VKTEAPTADQAIRENKLKLVERLADDLAHEIKNPLHSMVINLEVLRRRIARLESDSNEELLRYAGVLGSELERVNRRVDLLLRMVRPNRGSDEVASIPEIMEELQELLELECERHHVQLNIAVPAGLFRPHLPRAPARQMILTLILKTLDFVPEKGTLSVESSVEGETVQLSFRGAASDGTPVEAAGDNSDSYLAVASALAEQLGGRLDVAEGAREVCEQGHFQLVLGNAA